MHTLRKLSAEVDAEVAACSELDLLDHVQRAAALDLLAGGRVLNNDAAWGRQRESAGRANRFDPVHRTLRGVSAARAAVDEEAAATARIAASLGQHVAVRHALERRLSREAARSDKTVSSALEKRKPHR